MSLPIRKLVSAGKKLAFSLTPDVQASGTYVCDSDKTYNPNTGKMEGTGITVSVDFIRAPIDEKLVNGVSIRFGDQKIVIDREVLTEGGVGAISTNDTIEESGGETYQIVGFREDPTKQVVVIHARRLADQG